jgi:Ran GTPase-activating protein (RanGAP) involved in mRNA processing and transport
MFQAITICHQPLQIEYGFTRKREKCINQVAWESTLEVHQMLHRCKMQQNDFKLTSHRNCSGIAAHLVKYSYYTSVAQSIQCRLF